MNIPTTLKHKPVITVENYENVDGRQAYNSDAKGLSLGLAQWNDRGKVEISAKVWRYTGEKWSRQSEEMLTTARSTPCAATTTGCARERKACIRRCWAKTCRRSGR